MLKTLFRKKSLERVMQEYQDKAEGEQLHKVLTVRDLTLFGIAAIVGAGIYSTIGSAVVNGGPGVSLLFACTALACGLSAMCYAQFASVVPVSGSSYTYAYAVFGELPAWILGWSLVMEYVVSNIVVAISWSDYFSSFMGGIGLPIPEYLCSDYFSAKHAAVDTALHATWLEAPSFAGIHFICDIPAFVISVLVTVLCYIGIQESRKANNVIVIVKLLIIALVVVAGAFYVKPENWHPFLPHGVSGVLSGVSAVFFAYIGFDAISTTAEECQNPQRDLPKAMFWALGISTIIYILITLVLTGVVPYYKLGVGDPLSFVFEEKGLNIIAGIVSASAVVTLISVMLVYQLGQPRIWMIMSRDGLLPEAFSKIHSRFKTPSFATIITGIMVAVPSLFMNIAQVTDLSSIGTLFAFAIVCAGVLVIDRPSEESKRIFKFRIPYLNARYVSPIALGFIIAFWFTQPNLQEYIGSSCIKSGFLAITILLLLIAFWKRWSFIPVAGIMANLFLMTEIKAVNWINFSIWLCIGLVVYGLYGFRKSKLVEA